MPTSSAVHVRVTVSMTQNEPSACPWASSTGKPAHARTPMPVTDGLSRTRGSSVVSPTTSGARSAMTYWQKLSSTGFDVAAARSTPSVASQNERSSSTSVRNAMGACSSRAASAVSPTQASRVAASSSPVLRTAARRAGSKTAASTPTGSALPCAVTHHYGARTAFRPLVAFTRTVGR